MTHTEIETDDDELPESCVDAVLTPKQNNQVWITEPRTEEAIYTGSFHYKSHE
jgi:hypothetical protein